MAGQPNRRPYPGRRGQVALPRACRRWVFATRRRTVRVPDRFEANNIAYIVMDYEDGEPLDALLERHGTLTEA